MQSISIPFIPCLLHNLNLNVRYPDKEFDSTNLYRGWSLRNRLKCELLQRGPSSVSRQTTLTLEGNLSIP